MAQQPAATIADLSKKVAVIGATGNGKSALCNLLSSRGTSADEFPESANISSKTFETTVRKTFWAADKSYPFHLIDTPGLGDSHERDTEHIANMIGKLKVLQTVNAFVIVFNGEAPRIDGSLRVMMKEFKKMFGAHYLRNVILVFTRWYREPRAVARRKQQKCAESDRTREFTQYMAELGMEAGREAPCFFMDVKVFDDQFAGEEEKQWVVKTLAEMRRYVWTLPAFPCNDFQAIKSFQDQLKADRELAEKLWKDEQVRADIQTRKAQEAAERADDLQVQVDEAKEKAKTDESTIQTLQDAVTSAEQEAEALRNKELTDDEKREAMITYVMDKHGISREKAMHYMDENGGTCFATTTVVARRAGGPAGAAERVPMAAVTAGDFVQTPAGWSQVMFVLPVVAPQPVVELHFRASGGEARSLAMTAHHLLHDARRGCWRAAGQFSAGDAVSVEDEARPVVLSAVVREDEALPRRVCSIVTMNGELYAEGVRASCYAYSHQWHVWAHRAAAVPRMCFKAGLPDVAAAVCRFGFRTCSEVAHDGKSPEEVRELAARAWRVMRQWS